MDKPTTPETKVKESKPEIDAQAEGKTDVKPAEKPVRIVTKDELERKFKAGSVQIVNVLEPKDYALGMIKGSKKIPLATLEKRFTELDKSKEVVAYCSGTDCGASHEAAELLAAKGFNVGAYEGGAKEWKAAGLPTE